MGPRYDPATIPRIQCHQKGGQNKDRASTLNHSRTSRSDATVRRGTQPTVAMITTNGTRHTPEHSPQDRRPPHSQRENHRTAGRPGREEQATPTGSATGTRASAADREHRKTNQSDIPPTSGQIHPATSHHHGTGAVTADGTHHPTEHTMIGRSEITGRGTVQHIMRPTRGNGTLSLETTGGGIATHTEAPQTHVTITRVNAEHRHRKRAITRTLARVHTRNRRTPTVWPKRPEGRQEPVKTMQQARQAQQRRRNKCLHLKSYRKRSQAKESTSFGCKEGPCGGTQRVTQTPDTTPQP